MIDQVQDQLYPLLRSLLKSSPYPDDDFESNKALIQCALEQYAGMTVEEIRIAYNKAVLTKLENMVSSSF